MDHSFLKRLNRVGLTRISVTGSSGVFQVRIGAGDTIDSASVRMERGGLRCDCGYRACRHIESLEACGFLATTDHTRELADAA
jgi:hypothetical protein